MYQNEYGYNLRPRNPACFQRPMPAPPRCMNAPFPRRPLYHVRKRIMNERLPGHMFRPFPRQPHYRPKLQPMDCNRSPQNPIRSFPPRYNFMEHKQHDIHFSGPSGPPQMNENTMYQNQMNENTMYQNTTPPGRARGGFHRYDGNMPCDSANFQMSSETPCRDELWIETQSSDGKHYYYNARTRETVWCRPDNVKVLTQEQVKELSATVGAPTPDLASTAQQFTNGAVVQVNSDSPQNIFMGPQAMELRTINPSNLIMFPPPTYGVSSPSLVMHNFPLSSYPIGYPGMIPQFIPGFGTTLIPPQSVVGTEAMSNNSKEGIVDDNKVDNECHNDKNQSNIITTKNEFGIVEEWTIHLSPHGQVYYHEKVKNITTWEKPQSFVNVDKEEGGSSETVKNIDVNDASCDNTATTTFHETLEMDIASENEVKLESDSQTISNSDACGISFDLQEAKEELKTEMKEVTEVDKSRPVSSTPIAGTAWCIVWTGDSRVFYYNPNQKLSVWERPSDLDGRVDVDKLIQSQPGIIEPKFSTEPEIKKLKMNDSKDPCENSESSSDGSGLSQKEKIIEAEAIASKERDTIPLETRMETFRTLLEEKNVSAFSTWEKELHKIVFDHRYLLLSFKERRKVFESYLREKGEKEKNDRKKKVRQQRDEYKKLLKEVVSSKMRFSELAQRHGKDERFKAVEKMSEKEDIFNDYMRDLRRKEKEMEASLAAKAEKKFMEMLKEQKHLSKNSKWSETKEKLSHDERLKGFVDEVQQERIFNRFIRGRTDDESLKEKEKQQREHDSIKGREEEVKRTLSVQLKTLDRERQMHKREESISCFRALLIDLIQNTSISWHSAKKVLKKDHRWDVVRHLEKKDRDRIFDDHIELLNKKKRAQFHEFLSDVPKITLNSSWKEVRSAIMSDPICEKFSNNEKKCEREFNVYLENKLNVTKSEFRELLGETKVITYKSKSLLNQSDHLGDIEKALQNDKRYLILDFMEHERRNMLISYIEDLHNKGPPPPPTASDPQKR